MLSLLLYFVYLCQPECVCMHIDESSFEESEPNFPTGAVKYISICIFKRWGQSIRWVQDRLWERKQWTGLGDSGGRRGCRKTAATPKRPFVLLPFERMVNVRVISAATSFREVLYIMWKCCAMLKSSTYISFQALGATLKSFKLPFVLPVFWIPAEVITKAVCTCSQLSLLCAEFEST